MPKTPFIAPLGTRLVRIDRKSGKRVYGAWPGRDPMSAVIWEAFKAETEPKRSIRQEELAARGDKPKKNGANGGSEFHEDPQVLHYGIPGTGIELVPGMIFTIEPMINAGRKEIKELGDGWTIVTKDHSLSAQWEHTVLVTPTGYEVLTLSANSPALPEFVTPSA